MLRRLWFDGQALSYKNNGDGGGGSCRRRHLPDALPTTTAIDIELMWLQELRPEEGEEKKTQQ